MLVSDRGIPLVCQSAGNIPVLTVENYCKWYDLYLVFPDGKVEAVQSDDARCQVMQETDNECMARYRESAYGDHTFNPRAVCLLAIKLKAQLDMEAYEMIVGRWEIEYKNNYQYFGDTL